MPIRFTVLGSRGYVGSHLAAELRQRGDAEVWEDSGKLPADGLGHVFFCIGVTTDFHNRLHDTMRAHVAKLMDVLDAGGFDSFTYLSSTRVYERGSSGKEDGIISVEPGNIGDYYKISKVAGEAVCLAHPRPTVRVARLSNVIGFEQPPLTFVPSLIRDALQHGTIALRTALDSAKDYVCMEDVVSALPLIALHGRERLYNVSSGLQTTHQEIVGCISRTLGCDYSANRDAPRSTFPETTAEKLLAEFGFRPESILDKLPDLCRRYAEMTKPS